MFSGWPITSINPKMPHRTPVGGSRDQGGAGGGLADYALAPDRRRFAGEVHPRWRARFSGHHPRRSKAEMLALAEVSAHSKDPIHHYVLSWPRGEQPTSAQIEEAIDVFLDTMGLVGHQTLYGLHADTDNVHLHLMVNRVHPITRKVIEINKGFDLEALHRAVARIEHVQGWRREARGRYRVRVDGTIQRERLSPLETVLTDAQRVRNRQASALRAA